MRWNKFKIAYGVFAPLFLYVSITNVIQKSEIKEQREEFCNYCKELLITYSICFTIFVGIFSFLLMKIVKQLREIRKMYKQLKELKEPKEPKIIISD